MVAHSDFVVIKSSVNRVLMLFSDFLKVTKIQRVFSLLAEKGMECGLALTTT
jgi:hypothetical protein